MKTAERKKNSVSARLLKAWLWSGIIIKRKLLLNARFKKVCLEDFLENIQFVSLIQGVQNY